MRKKSVIALFCMMLIVTSPMVLSQRFSTSSDFNLQESEPIVDFTTSPFDRASAVYSKTFGTPQDVGEALIIYAGQPQPPLIRASLAEDQEIPVFIPLKTTDIGSVLSTLTGDVSERDPFTGLTSIPRISNVVVRLNKTNPYVKTVRYIPPKTGFTKDNLGYLVVILNKLKNETSLPTSGSIQAGIASVQLPGEVFSSLNNTPVIPLELNAEILFDLTSGTLLSLGEQTLTLKQESEQAFLQKPSREENAFYNKRAYLRANAISSDRVSFTVYNKELHSLSLFNPPNEPAGVPVSSLTLSRSSPESRPIRLRISSNALEDTVRFRLNEIVLPEDRVSYRLIAGGKTYERKANIRSPLFPRSRWEIQRIAQSDPEPTTLKDLIEKGIILDTTSEEKAKQAASGELKLITHTLVLRNTATGETRTLQRNVLTGLVFSFDTAPVDDTTASFLEKKYCPEPDPDKADLGCAAVHTFKKITQDFPHTAEAKDSHKQLFEIYEQKLIDYAACDKTGPNPNDVANLNECQAFLRDTQTLAYYYASKIQASDPELIQRLQAGYGGAGGFEYLTDEGISVQLNYVEKITNEEKGSATLRVNGVEHQNLRVGINIPGTEGTAITGEPFTLEISAIRSSTVHIIKRAKTSQRVLGSSQTLVLGKNNVLLQERRSADGRVERESVDIELVNVNTNVEASVSIIPNAGLGLARSSFTVIIPVEPRPLKNIGEKLKDHINATRKLVADLDKVIQKLDSVVRTWKKICLVTFAFVTVKSSFLGGTTRALARRGVSELYKKDCNQKASTGLFESADDCLASRADDISKDVDANQRAIEHVQQELSGQTPATLKTCGDVPFQEVKALGATIDDCRDYLRLNALRSDTISDTLAKGVDQQLSALKFEGKKQQYEAAEQWLKGYPDFTRKFGEDEDARLEALRFYTNSAEAQKESATSQKNVLPLSHLLPTEDNKATALLPQTGTNDLGPTTLVKVTRLQRAVYESGAEGVVSSIQKAYCKDLHDPQCIQGQLDLWNSISDEPLYARQEFVNPATLIKNLGTAHPYLSSYTLLTTKNKALAISSTTPPADFNLYSSQVVDVNNQLRSLDYAYSQGAEAGGDLLAQYDPESGQAFCYPTGRDGEYVLVLERFQGTGKVKIFRAMNVGLNGVIECGSGDDVIVLDESALSLPANQRKRLDYLSIVDRAPRCQKEGTRVGSVTKKNGKTVGVRCSTKQAKLNLQLNSPKCIDVMEPEDCTILFNACDPVMCPATRCNLGGKYQVDDVIQSGIVGSVFLCAPNVKQGVVVPFCLTGILAGLKHIKSILQSYADCLEANLKDGKNVGFCDYIRSVGVCELIWRETINLFNIKGGVIDYLSEKAFGEPEGGAEYLTFQQSLQNVGDSFNYFTTEYSNTYVAALKGSSTEEIGSQVCRLGVYGRLPTVGDVLDKLSEPEDPPQFFALLDEAPYVQDIGEAPLVPRVPSSAQALSNYKIFYHIYAGTGFAAQQAVFTDPVNQATGRPNKAVTYSVYLINKELGLPPLYMTSEEELGQVSATIPRGQYVQKSVQRVSQTGYNEVCINLNGKPSCGFGKVSSAFSLNYINDKLVEAEAGKKIKSAEECLPDPPTTGAALGSFVTPERYGLVNTGVVRVCNPTPPTADTTRWAAAGECGKDKNGVDRGICWLDRNSLNIKNLETRSDVLGALKQRDILKKQGLEGDILTAEQSNQLLEQLRERRDHVLEKLRLEVQRLLEEEA